MDNKKLFNIFKEQIKYAIKETNFNIGPKYKGKVRDVYDLGNQLLIITTDRISAFDKVLGTVPFKGEILNNLSLFWFEKTKDIIENHIIDKINENTILVKKCNIIPVEFIIRGYLTGGGYREYLQKGEISGIKLPENLKKNTKFDYPILTPTIKSKEGHDLPITKQEIIEKNIISEELFNKIEEISVKLYFRAQEIVNKNNLILVDTKYEFGLMDNKLILADEIHTSDSSRYWFLDSYNELYNQDKEQKMLDKEYFRQWLLNNNYKGEGEPPIIPEEVFFGVFERYLTAYQYITGQNYIIENKNSIEILNKSILNYFDKKFK